MILLGHDQAVADWVSGITGKPFHAIDAAIGSVTPEGRLTGGFVFTGHNGDSIEMSLAGHGVTSRGMWRAVIRYVFGQLGCSRLQIHTAASNKAVRKLAPKLGFTFEGKARRFYGNEDAFLYSLTVDDLPAFCTRWRL